MIRLLHGDAIEMLRMLPAESVQCCVTSPPYWGLRDYGVPGQLGIEKTPEAYTAALVAVFREVRRVLRADGTCWINLGDSYNAYNGNRGASTSISALTEHAVPTLPKGNGLTAPALKNKDLVGIPWRVAFALQADGWYLRSDIIWSKPNPMPESVTDRPTKAHEYLFLLSKAARYYYDGKAIAEGSIGSHSHGAEASTIPNRNDNGRLLFEVGDTRNRRSVWHIATQPFPGAHFATMPEDLVVPCVKAGSRPGDTVLDPFCGSGTVGEVSLKLGRDFTGIDLSAAYIEMSRKRIEGSAPLFYVEAAP